MDNQDLIKRIEALEKWKADRERQQIVYPLDFQSQQILAKYFMHITGTVFTTGGAGGNIFTHYIGNQDNLQFQVDKNTFIPYTVVPSTNVFTVTGGTYFEDDTQVYVSTEDTPPSPLVAGDPYFIINSTGQTFKLSLTQGGAEINITDTGTGRQYIYFY